MPEAAGYRRGPDGQPEIVPKEAEVVKRIYRRYMEQDVPETERQAGEVLRALVEKSLEIKETQEQ